ncbi:hypothetical protein Clacol_009805 [Clathrus columnatus]|uniref:DUF6533 domain-containing protein n=1 Tax=Clathrus columnatus TaxID=1419009 RepID=A0AAV5ALH9_9AGAM|nr:hypothetical protein Clacol_009805 [Clathrus columnatus]
METEMFSVIVNASSTSTHLTPALLQTAVHLQASKYFQVASGVILIYDHLITFGQEIEQIWTQPWTGATLLFALIRYISTLQRPIITAAFLSAEWSQHVYVKIVVET